MQGLAKSFRDPITLVLVVLVALGALGAWDYAEDTPGLDYYVAWVAADAVKNDNKSYIYDPASSYKLPLQYRNKADAAKDAPRLKLIAAHGQEMSFTATPFMYWVTSIIAVGDYETDLTVWHAISLMMLAAFILVISRLLGYSVATSLAILLPVIVWFAPLHSDLRVGNVNCFQLGLIGIVLWLQNRAGRPGMLFVAGLVLGLTVMFKPNLAPIGLILAGSWIVRKQFPQLITGVSGMLTGVLSAALVSSWWLGSVRAWLDWFNVIVGTVSLAPGKQSGSYSVMRQLTGGLSPSGQLILALVLVVAALALFWWGRRKQPVSTDTLHTQQTQSLEDTLLIAMGCMIAMMASALVWPHYYLLTIPLLLVMLRPWNHDSEARPITVLMQRLLPLVALVGLMDSALPRILEMDGREFRTIAAKTSILVLFVAGMWQLAYGVEKYRANPDPD